MACSSGDHHVQPSTSPALDGSSVHVQSLLPSSSSHPPSPFTLVDLSGARTLCGRYCHPERHARRCAAGRHRHLLAGARSCCTGEFSFHVTHKLDRFRSLCSYAHRPVTLCRFPHALTPTPAVRAALRGLMQLLSPCRSRSNWSSLLVMRSLDLSCTHTHSLSFSFSFSFFLSFFLSLFLDRVLSHINST